MPRVSGTFKKSTKALTDAYAELHGISFSEAMEIFTGQSAIEWFNSLPVSKKKEINEKYEVFLPIKKQS